MKKCPKCGAQIDDNARFCVYCMTDFSEKTAVGDNKDKSSKVVIISVISALFALILAVFLILNGNRGKKGPDSPKSSLPFVDNSSISFDGSSSSEIQHTGSDESSSSKYLSGAPSSSSTKSGSSSSKPSGGGSSSSKKPTTTSTAIQTSTPGTTTTSKPSTSLSSVPESSAPTSSQYPASSAEYLYRDAKPIDDSCEANSTLTNGCITITGVSKADDNGIYVIPETIDGKKVVAIDGPVFCDDAIEKTVKIVVIPSGVISVNGATFYDCCNLSDIYIKSKAMYIQTGYFFPRTRNCPLTMRAAANAHNRDLRKLSVIAGYNNCEFEPWDGGAID